MRRLTIEEMEQRCPDILEGQVPRGVRAEYRFVCEFCKEEYWQIYADHHRGCKHNRCSHIGKGMLTIEEMGERFSDMARIPKQVCRGTHATYKFLCGIHGEYEQRFDTHGKSGCPKCGSATSLQKLNFGLVLQDLRCSVRLS